MTTFLQVLVTGLGLGSAYALFAHCFTCGKDVLAAKRIAVALAAQSTIANLIGSLLIREPGASKVGPSRNAAVAPAVAPSGFPVMATQWRPYRTGL